jgi:signal transduction histidine kinase
MKLALVFLTLILFSGSTYSQDTSDSRLQANWVDPNTLFKSQETSDTVAGSILASIEADKKFLQKLPESYDRMTPDQMKNFAQEIESKLQQLIKEKEELIKNHASSEVIAEKERSIGSLSKEKSIVDLSVKKEELTEENETYERWLVWATVATLFLILIIILVLVALRQRNRIVKQSRKIVDQYDDIQLKGSYLEYAARLIRHDLHSGINTYIPRGMSSLERRLTAEAIASLKIDGPLKMIKEGLAHTQRVYHRVHDFTSMVKHEAAVEKYVHNTGEVLADFLKTTAYSNSVMLESDMPDHEINPTLFCTAIDNLIRNGLKYNDSAEKTVNIYSEGQYIVIEDNGRGLSQTELEIFSKQQSGSTDQADAGEGLGLKISIAIFNDHGFSLTAERLEPNGTKMKIKKN